MSSSVVKSDITDINMEVERKINMTAALFPFVCGICYEKFNKIDVYYLHLQAHNQNTSECFHICNDSENRTQTGSKLNDDRNIFQCGSCSKPFFSICTLHKHMIDVYDIGSYEFDQNSNTAFPKGEMHKNACFRHEVHLENGISQADIEAGDNDLENEAKVECQETVDNDSGTNITQLKEQTLPVSGKTKRKIKEHKNEIKQKEAKRKKSKEEIEPKEPNVADNETPLKRSRGKQPTPVTKSATKKSKSKRTCIISEVSLKLDKSDIKPLRSKALKTSKQSKEEKGSKKTKKRENKDQTKAIIEGQNKVKEKHIASVHDWNVENIHANNGINADSEDVKSITDVKSSPMSDKENGKEDTAVKDEDINSDLNYVTIKCEVFDKDIKDTDEKKVQVRKKRQKIDKANDGDTVIEKKKSKKYFYTCNICGKTMGLSHKKRHNAIHAAAIEGKPKQEYETCDICGKSIVKAGFKLHQALHSDDRPYLCDRCPKSFKLKSNLHHHKQVIAFIS